MAFLLLRLLAFLLLLAPRSTQFASREHGPRSYRSESGEFELHVDPSARDGSGPATYRLSKKGVVLWKVTHPFTWSRAVVCDDGASAGFAHTAGDKWFLKGNEDCLVVSVLEPSGALRSLQSTARKSSDFLHEPANPHALDVLLFEDRDRFVVRITDDDVNRQSEVWQPYTLSTGEARVAFRPKDGQAERDELHYVIAAVRVRETPLVLVQWFQTGPFVPGEDWTTGTRFGLVDELGASVWTLELPEDFTRGSFEASNEVFNSVLAREHGSIARCDVARRFELDLLREARRATFEVVPNGATWGVREVTARAPFEPAPKVVETREALPGPKPLARVGVLDLETAKGPEPFVNSVGAFAFDRTGNVAFLQWKQEPSRLVLAYADARGAAIATNPLSMAPKEGGRYVDDLAWIADDVFAVGWSAYSSAKPEKARIYAVSARTGETKLLVDDIGYELDGLASFGDGRFVTLGDNRLDAFDREGKRAWKLSSADGLCGAEGVAVLEGGRVVVHDGQGLQWISESGKLGRYDSIEKLWGRKPRYLHGVEADVVGGIVVEDSDTKVRTTSLGKLVAMLTPRFANGRVVDGREVLAGPGGRLRTHDAEAILGLDPQGKVEIVLGSSIDAERVTEVATIALDADDRIYAVAERTANVHVIDVEKGLVRVLRPSPADFAEQLEFTTASLVVDDERNVYLRGDESSESRPDAKSYVHWTPEGMRRGVVSGLVADPFEQWIDQPGTKNRWLLGTGARLVGPDGATLAQLDRKPDGQWLGGTNEPSVAPDGSIAFLGGRSAKSDEDRFEAVIYDAKGASRAQVPLATRDTTPQHLAYDGDRVVVLVGDRLHVHDLVAGTAREFTLPGLEGRTTTFWTPLLPRKRAEVWLFDNRRTLHRYALPRG